jgi:hypothetical protein
MTVPVTSKHEKVHVPKVFEHALQGILLDRFDATLPCLCPVFSQLATARRWLASEFMLTGNPVNSTAANASAFEIRRNNSTSAESVILL